MIWFLHGAVGQPLDWKEIASELGRKGELVRSVDLYRYLDCCPMSLEEFGRAFCEEVAAVDETPVIVGYSMGARLALHALLHQSKMWKSAVLLSAHPGLQDEREKFERMVIDAEWGAQALTGDWDVFITKWNAQSVLAEDQMPSRALLKQRRQAVARSFMDWTLSKQKDLRPRFNEITCPVNWFTGENDEKFRALTEGTSFPDHFKVMMVANQGHRLINATDLLVKTLSS